MNIKNNYQSNKSYQKMQQSQRSQYAQGRTIKEERQQVTEEYQIPVESRTNKYTTYEYRTQERVINPRRVVANRTTNYNLIRDLNRQATVNTVVKNQIQNQVSSRQNAYDSNINQSQDRSSREGKVYHYEPATRKEFQGRTVTKKEQRGRVVSSVESSQKGKVQYRKMENENYKNKIYVSDSNSPGYRRYSKHMEEENYQSNTRGGIVKLKRWKYTTQTEINKIIMIQRWWKYMLLIRKEQRQSITESSEQKSDNVYEENERYGHYGDEAYIKTETKLKKNAKEKIIAGTKNRYIVETTTIEVFKNQNTFLKKVEPEELTKETKKIKKKSIKEQMIEIWNRENVGYSTESLSLISDGVTKTTEIIEEYEVQLKQYESFMNQKEEEIIQLTKKIETYEAMKTFTKLKIEAAEMKILSEKKEWNKIIKEKKESKFSIKRNPKI